MVSAGAECAADKARRAAAKAAIEEEAAAKAAAEEPAAAMARQWRHLQQILSTACACMSVA